VVLAGNDNGGGLSVRSGTATVISDTGTTAYAGTLARIDNGVILVTPSAPSHSEVDLAISVEQLDQTRGTVSGTVRALTATGERGDDG
jgi:hypothetical protein